MNMEDVKLLRVITGDAMTLYADGDLRGNSSVCKAGEHHIEAGALGSISIASA